MTEEGFWTEWFFDRPVTTAIWYEEVALGREWNPVPDDKFLSFATGIFADSRKLEERYTASQIAAGLDCITTMLQRRRDLASIAVAASERARCVDSMPTVFEAIFERIGGESDESPALPCALGSEWPSLGSVCLSWWTKVDVQLVAVAAPHRIVGASALAAMARVLDLGSRTCQWSALLGLSQWRYNWPDDVDAILSGYLRSRGRGRAHRSDDLRWVRAIMAGEWS